MTNLARIKILNLHLSSINSYSMKKIAYFFPFFLIVLSSCFEVKKLEISGELQEKLDMSKPTVIDPSEINGVACEIGDSIFKSLEINQDSSFLLGKNYVAVFGQASTTDSLLKSKFDAYAYSFTNDSSFVPKGVVKYGVKDTVAYYENAFRLDSNQIKLVQIKVDLSEVNLKVVHERMKLKKKKK